MKATSLITRYCLLAAIAAIAPASDSWSAQGQPGKIIRVDCTKPMDSLTRALADKADQLIIEFSGQCFESVVVPRGNVTLRGVSADAEVVGPGATASAPADGVTVEGFSRVRLESFTVRGWSNRGIAVSHQAEVSLSGMAATANLRGMGVDGGAAVQVTDSRFDGNTLRGFQVFGGSAVQLAGSVSASATYVGVLASGGSLLQCALQAPCQLEVSDNWVGFWLQAGASGAVFGGANVSLKAHRNTLGVVLLGSQLGLSKVDMQDNRVALSLSNASALDLFRFGGTISNSTSVAIEVTESSVARVLGAGQLVISGGPYGVWVGDSSWVLLSQFALQGHSIAGLVLDGANARIDNVDASGNSTDASLSFGSRVDFVAGNSFPTVACDATAQTRGDVNCPTPPATALAGTSVQSIKPAHLAARPSRGLVQRLEVQEP